MSRGAPGDAPGPMVLLAGGAGYIGLHIAVELLAAGYQVLIADDFSNSHAAGPARVEALTGRRPIVVTCDLRARTRLDWIFSHYPIEAVVHLAGLKSAPASLRDPVRYYEVNLGCVLSLLAAMQRHEVRRLVFSSSAMVYAPADRPLGENAPLEPVTPYGQTKLMAERMLGDFATSRRGFAAMSLRYFNPVGAHPSGLIGEDPKDEAAGLFPGMADAALGRRPALSVFGTDWPTPDGSAIRDFIHVVDLARGHRAALEYLGRRVDREGSHLAVNLGRGEGFSVREVLTTFAQVSGHPLAQRDAGRRPGDVAVSVADPSRAADLLNWRAEHDLAAMCRDQWRWCRSNPRGYAADPVSAAPRGPAQPERTGRMRQSTG